MYEKELPNKSVVLRLPLLFLVALCSIITIFSCKPEKFEKPDQELDELMNSPLGTSMETLRITGGQSFAFLPPIGKTTTFNGIFDAKLNPLVEICELPECNPPYHAVFTKDGAGSERIRVDVTNEHYIVNWHTKVTGVKPGSTYRITVKLNNMILGFTDVTFAGGKDKSKDGPNKVKAIAGQTIPIKFRIEKQDEQSAITLMTNGADPLFLTAKSQNNKTIEVYGSRDEQGIPIRLTDIILKGQTEDEVTHYKYDINNRLNKIITSNKTQFIFTWSSEQKAAVTVLASDGSTQFNTEIDFSNQLIASASNNGPKLESTKLKRGGLPLKLEYKSNSKRSIPSALAAMTTASSSVNINVERCGEPANADVMLSVSLVDGGKVGTFPASYQGPGLYTSTLPTNLAPTINPGDICKQLEGVLGFACNFNDIVPLMCTPIFLVVSSSPFAYLAPAIAAACAEAALGLNVYCSTLGFDGGTGAPTVAEKLCNSPVLNRKFTQDLILRPLVIGLPTNIYGASVRVPGDGPFPNLSVGFNSKPTIESLTLNPPIPASGQNYVAKVDVYCVPQNSQVKMSVVGTDGYTDEITYNITSTQARGTFNLTVPGADSGVQDIVTVQILLADGSIITRSASLVFN